MHPPDVKAAALALLEAGLNDCEIARRTGIPRTTIRDWRRPRYERRRQTEICPRCWGGPPLPRFAVEDYAELLGVYLGDGTISQHPRTFRLRVSLDLRHERIVAETEQLIARLLPANAVSRVCRSDGAVDVSVYNRHLPCLFPQHGAGAKHRRRIALEAWQLTTVCVAPWPFLRGCIRTDGCFFVNRTGPYAYPSYHFSNRSLDIARLVAFALRHVGVEYRLTSGCRRGMHNIRVNRRASVELMFEHVGFKD